MVMLWQVEEAVLKLCAVEATGVPMQLSQGSWTVGGSGSTGLTHQQIKLQLRQDLQASGRSCGCLLSELAGACCIMCMIGCIGNAGIC